MANPIIRRNTDVGAADAESDSLYLENCFVDTGDVANLLDCENPRCIVLGRTGVGKTALLMRIRNTAGRVAELSPETLSLHYVTNSNVLRFFEEAGVELDIFYALLWRHIIAVELLKMKFDINDAAKQTQFFDWVKGLFTRDKAKERALKYLSDWGNKFWEETEYRTKEFTKKLETDLTAAAKIDVRCIALGVEGARKLTAEETFDVKQRAMNVVNAVQVKELHDVITFLAQDIFDDPKQTYYLLIDRLDEDWVDDRIRFKLIRALLETVRTFRRIRPVKIIVALRTDLHYRVLREIRKPGFQEEKYNALYLQIRWTREQLANVLDKRVSFMFKRQYTRADVTLTDLLPRNQIDQRTAVDYILDRTFFRPREAIIYLNECLKRAEGQTRITVTILRQAEVPYSQRRLTSLVEEWRREFPRLEDYVKLLEHRESSFELSEITKEDCDAFANSMLADTRGSDDPVYQMCEEYYTRGGTDFQSFLYPVIEILYHVGVVGVKTEPHLARQWSQDDHPFLTRGQLKSTSTIDVHKTFWAALGIVSKGRATVAKRHSRN